MIGRLVWNQGGQVERGKLPWDRERPRALVEQGLGRLWGLQDQKAQPHGYVDKSVVKMLQQQHPWDPTRMVLTFFSMGQPS